MREFYDVDHEQDEGRAVLALYSGRLSADSRSMTIPGLSDDRHGVNPLTTSWQLARVSGGFSGAKVWHVTTPAGEFALRRWPDRELPRQRILGMHRLLNHIQLEGLNSIAVPVLTDSGTTLPHTDGSEWQLEPWLSGCADFHDRPSEIRLRSAMQALARWHLVATRFRPKEIEATWFGCRDCALSPAILERFGMIDSIRDDRLAIIEHGICQEPNPTICNLARQILEQIRRLRAQVAFRLRTAREVAVPLQPVMRDVWHDHILFTGDEVTGIVDCSACRMDSVACDLSRLVGSLIGDNPVLRSVAFDAYQELRSLSPAENELIGTLDQSGVVLSGWTWLNWLYIDKRRFEDLSKCCQRLTAIEARLRAITH